MKTTQVIMCEDNTNKKRRGLLLYISVQRYLDTYWIMISIFEIKVNSF